MTEGRSAPSNYRVNLVLTLYDLSTVRQRQSRVDEEEKLLREAVAVADVLERGPALDDESKEIVKVVRQALAEFAGQKTAKVLDQKDAEAYLKYEEAQVKRHTDGHRAEGLFREAIAGWEEILPQVDDPEYRKSTIVQLATSYVLLGELRRKLGDRAGSESSLKKAIDYGEKAVALEPARPLPKHNLDVVRRMLEELGEQNLDEQIEKLSRTEHFADAIDLFKRSIKEQDDRAQSSAGSDAAVASLAYRLERFSWLLAHCPDKRLRDTKAAVQHARRAVELRPDIPGYWYTFAMAQYRNGDWQDSLASLGRLKAIQGEYDASDWILYAMDLFQLKRIDQARSAMRKATDWLDEKRQQAEDDAMLRMELEMMRPSVESLLWEARNLIGGVETARPKDA